VHCTLKEKYNLLLTENSNGFFDILNKEAKSFGVFKITKVSESEIILEGKNKPITQLCVWVLKKHLAKVKHLTSYSQETS
jgi:hypothetical protein